ncbi:RelA/SpoT family protein [Patescibacteria group bacterium]|nr:RelA/SpoT family protein [Patescibacteria group bacterium]MBU2218972.1 RelA/SpoT family protein [Patescibacteria group bacterium]MBU2263524.1 RelA/SpoT family protein [Patescibacteria group bacterium]
MQDVNEIINLLKSHSKSDIELITKAFEFSQKAHEGQERFSREPYFIHPFEVAKDLANLQLDSKTIAAALLHDVCEDKSISEKTIKKEFGDETAFLVAGVTKLGQLKYHGAELQIENLRKMFLAMAKDIRVILIRLADRVHNMKTLQYVPEEKQKRIALETLEIYAPLANRLGMGKFKGQLEDLAFQYVYPEEYKKIKEMIKGKYEEKEKDLIKVKYGIEKELRENDIKYFHIDSRVKHLYSLFKKLQRPEINMNIDIVYDLIALRIIVKTIEDCYKVLGIIHKMWKPIPGKIKDYIATPKPNGYQSLHTTVFATGGKITEIQIRTEQMHEEAEYGIAAHWAYAESGKPREGGRFNPRLSWVNQLIEWQKGTKASKDFLETLRIDFFKDRVFCFTPKGDVIDLPEGATTIDFAYSIHSDIGNHASGAIVNNKFVSLDTVMKNGDIIEIQTQKNKKPSAEWLERAKTSLAKKQIRAAMKESGLFKRIIK